MTILKVSAIIYFGIFCLYECYKECRTDNENISANQINSLKISSEIAEIIAKGWLCLDYNLREYDISVTEKPDSWELKFSRIDLKPNHSGPFIYINKTNGEPIHIIHAK